MSFYSPRRVRQPQSAARIDWQNPLSAGLRMLATPALLHSIEVANSTPTAVVDTLGGDALGVSAFQLSGSGVNHHLVNYAAPLTNFPLTFLAICRRFTRPADTGLVSIGAGTQRHLLYVNQDAVAMFSGAGATTAQAVSSSSALGTTAGPAVWIAGRVHSASSRDVWRNGALAGTNTSAINTTASDTLAVGAYWDNNVPSLYFNGAIFLAAAWDRALSDYELSSLYQNPWQLFAPRRIWVPQAAITGLPTLSLPTYVPGSLTASGFRPRVTAT